MKYTGGMIIKMTGVMAKMLLVGFFAFGMSTSATLAIACEKKEKAVEGDDSGERFKKTIEFEKTIEVEKTLKGGKNSRDRFSISVDPRVELLAVVQHFTSWAPGGHIKSKTGYKIDVDDYFKDYRDHRATEIVQRLVEAGFTHDAPVAFMLHHGDPPQLELKHPYSDYLIGRSNGLDNLTELADALRDFAVKTNFMQFFRDHQELYSTHVEEVKSLTSGKDYVRILEDFFGESRKSYGVILPPLFAGGYGITIGREDGYDIFGVIGPCALKGERVTFACLNYIESITLHEWSHSFVNPLVDENYDGFKESQGLFEPIRGMMRKQAYPNWRIALYEHIVRACEIRLRAKLYQNFAKDKFLSYQEGKGFWYISFIDSLLDVYEESRDQYPNFSRFAPVIATGLARISVEELPEGITEFRGPLDAIFPRADKIYIVYPTAMDSRSLPGVKSDIEGFSHFLSSAQIKPVILSDKEALGVDWQDKIAFIYASPGGNLFLEQLHLDIPLNFRDKSIALGEHVYQGEGVICVTCSPNPFNRKLPFALVIANRPDDLVGASSRMGGRSEWNADYVIFRNNEVIITGHYQKENGTWSLASSGSELEASKKSR